MTHNVVLGLEHSVLNFYLNKEFSTISKVIITSESFLQALTPVSIENLISGFLNMTDEEKSEQKEQLKEQLKAIEINDDFYKSLQEKIKSLGKEMDIALKDYNFMSSISNTKYTLTLRTQTTSYSKYNIEKGSLLNSMKQLLEEYVFSQPKGSKSWKQFQFECFESEEIYKTVLMKKENNQLLLYASFGCFPPININLIGGGELYHSIDENFHFFKNKQETAYLRQHGILEKLEINKQERILSSGELKVINQATKQIDNVILELYLTQKGAVRIVNVTSNEHQVGVASQKGCVLYKSTKNYDKISLISLKDCGVIETTNPHYLLIKNEHELQEAIRQLETLPIDGLVFNYNCYHPVIEEIAEKKDIDIIYYDEPLQKSLEVTINWDDFSIEGATTKSQDNPFSSILSSEEKEKDELLERLKNIDLSTQQDNTKKQEYEQIEQLTQSMTASPNSSQAKMAKSNTFANVTTPQSGEKKSAIGMLADAALNKQESKPEEPQQQPQRTLDEQAQAQHNRYQQTNQQRLDSQSYNSNQLDSQSHEAVSSVFENSQQSSFPSTKMESTFPQNALNEDDVEKYTNVLATRLYSPAQVPSQGHIVDSQSLADVSDDGEIILVVSELEEITNPSLQYALPISSGTHSQAMMLISSPNDFFTALSVENPQEPLFNISVVDSDIKSSMLNELERHFENFSVIATRDDIPLLENHMNSLNIVYVKDALQPQDIEECRQVLLAFEKRTLMNYLKNK